MFEISEVEASRLREVTAPFSMDVMREFFLDKSKVFVIDYAKSQLKGKSLLIYLSNLDIPCEIKFSDDVTLDEKFEMLKCYIESRNLFSVPSFTRAFADALLIFKGVSGGKPFGSELLTLEEMKSFIEKNVATIEKSVRFCDSLPFYAVTTSRAYREEFGDGVEQDVEVVDDPFYVGQNVVDLFSLKNFFELYFSRVPLFAPVYFKRQFREQMFRGKNLFHYFFNSNNTLLGMLMGIAEDKLGPKDLEPVLHSAALSV